MIRTAALFLLGAIGACGTAAAPDRAQPQETVRADLYDCEGCEGALERDPATLDAEARIGPASEPGVGLTVSGTVYAHDGRTPVADVVIYAYQTNADGLYANGSSESVWSRRHGRLRGWVKTGANGKYRFDTIKPAPYPNATMPAHIHFTVLEPGRPPYWIDDIVFEGEFGVTDAYRAEMTNKGGNGIVSVEHTAAGAHVIRDIILERHPEETR